MKNTPFNLKEEIHFHDKDFNSTILLEDGERKLILFALDKEQIIPEHTTPVKAAIYVLEGHVKFFIENKMHVLKEGDMFFIPQDVVHHLKADSKTKFIVMKI